MNPAPKLQHPASAPGVSLGDIYYVLFRHKWRILLCSAVGIIAAAALHKFNPPPYTSDAKLFIRYVVMESKTPAPNGGDAGVKSPDQRGETIMDSEQEILTSLDLAKQVASVVGAEKILAKAGGGNDLNKAAHIVNAGLTVQVPQYSSVIRVAFQHPDPEIVQPVLREVIDRYLKMHVEIHRAVGIIGDFLIQETDQLRSRLAQTEEELRKAKSKAGVISLEDTKNSLTGQMAHLQNDIFGAQAELAERSSMFEQLTNQTPASNGGQTEQVKPPQAKVDEYRNASNRLELLRRREQELLSQFTEENSRVVNIRAQLGEAENAIAKLEREFPVLARTNLAAAGSSQNGRGRETIDLATEAARLNALQAKIKTLNAQMDLIRAQASTVDQVEGSIMELRRKKELEEANYRYYSASLEQSRINEALGTGKVSNISQIQTPSPAFVDAKKANKILLGVAVGGVAVGLAWSFLIELYLDRSVRRPIDVERLLGVPLFLSIPILGRSGKIKQLKSPADQPLELLDGNKSPGLLANVSSEKSNETTNSANSIVLHSFHETLRDRLISYFESVNLTHKPKLVAVTGLGRGSGVTTTAAGLASSLSETGEGNVLLVDMTAGQGSAHHFYRGKNVVGLEDILSTRDEAQVQEKLYVVAEEPGREKLSRILPQRFTKLVPKLKASNFDYIIFDMPPVSQISITPRLAGFMDMVLLVIESEKTDRDLVQRATSLLAQSNAHVGAVLNKSKNYVPAALHQEYLGNA
ncbi:MAG: Wzz/FepE/Etk N-terminal domain-containing protein [Opitutus sp.]